MVLCSNCKNVVDVQINANRLPCPVCGSLNRTATVELSVVVEATVPSLTILARSYFSTYFLWTAKDQTIQAKNIEDSHSGKSIFSIEHRASVVNAIFSAVSFLEASINEVYQDAVDNEQSYIGSLSPSAINNLAQEGPRVEQNLSGKKGSIILAKYQKALELIGIAKFDENSNLYSDAQLLINLRNSIMHFKPKSVGGQIKHELELLLKGKFPENKLMDGAGNSFYPDKCFGYGCASWALNTSKLFADKFFADIGITPNYQRVTFLKSLSS